MELWETEEHGALVEPRDTKLPRVLESISSFSSRHTKERSQGCNAADKIHA